MKKDNSKYSGELCLELDKINDRFTETKKYYDGLIKMSPIMNFDSEKIPSYFIVGLGGGYVEGEEYKYNITLKNGVRSIITTQASTKVYKCIDNKATKQKTIINLKNDSILEYITDSVILYKDAIYKQFNEIYMDEDAFFIYSDGITSGWSSDGKKFQYNNVQLSTKVYFNNEIILLDNLIVNPRENDVSGLGYFEGYENFGTLLVINKNIKSEVVTKLRKELSNLDLDVKLGISELERCGFVLRVLGHLTQHIEKAIKICHNYIRREFLNSRNINIRKY